MLTLLSLHPGMLERGLDESACVIPQDTPPLSLSPDCNQEEIDTPSAHAMLVILNDVVVIYQVEYNIPA